MVPVALACNNNSSDNSEKAKDKDSSSVAVTRWAAGDENEFLSDCVDKAKGANGNDTNAYVRCNCVLRQLEQHFPNLDSADKVLQDSAQASVYTKNCQ